MGIIREERKLIPGELRYPVSRPRRASAQVREVMDTELGCDVPQPFAAGCEEPAQQPAPAQFLQPRAHQFSALLPSRSKMPATSREILALPSRNSRPV